MQWTVLGRPAGQVFRRSENLNVAIFLDTINIMKVKLCMPVVLTELYPFIPLSVTVIVFQIDSSVKQCYLKI